METNEIMEIVPLLLDVTPTPSQAQKHIVRLPTEIIDQILTRLPSESVIALTLTCRHFYAEHFSRDQAKHLPPAERLSILYWLERDVPHLYLCHRCQYLHAWCHTSHTTVVSEGYCNNFFPRRNAISGSLFAPDFMWELTPFQIRLAMNRHVYGPLHGPSLSILGGSRRTLHHSFGVSRRQSWSARIINDNLYIHGTDTFEPLEPAPYHEEGAPRTYMTALPRLLLCPHLLIHSTSIPTTARSRHFSIPELTCDTKTGAMFRPIAGSVRSCRVCCTDYHINITQKQGRFTVWITKWQKLASCHSAYGPEWKKLLEVWELSSVRNYSDPDETQASVLRSETHAAGQVREEWNRRDAVRGGEVIEGTFVG
jgi:hypothetical protein